MGHHGAELGHVVRRLVVVVQFVGGADGRVHFVGGMESRKVDLVLVVVAPVQHHGLEPVTPEYFMWQIRRSGLKSVAAGLVHALQDDMQFKLVIHHVRGRHSLN